MSDLIRRADAIDAVENNSYGMGSRASVKAIKALPSAEATGDLISREDALRELNGACSNWEDDAKVQDIVMAIPSAKPTGDLISRADAIEAVRMSEHRITIADEQGGVGTVKWDMWGVYTAEAVEAIKALPSAEAEQVTGKLIDGLEMLRFFNQRAGRELWQTKPREIQNTDIKDADEILSKAISALSAEAVQGWIPCSERLPDNKTYVLTTIQVSGRQPHARSGFYHDGFFHNDNGDTWKATDREVRAWMPLPNPYKGGDSE